MDKEPTSDVIICQNAIKELLEKYPQDITVLILKEGIDNLIKIYEGYFQLNGVRTFLVTTCNVSNQLMEDIGTNNCVMLDFLINSTGMKNFETELILKLLKQTDVTKNARFRVLIDLQWRAKELGEKITNV